MPMIKGSHAQLAAATNWYGRVPPQSLIEITYSALPALRIAQAVEA